MNTESLKEAIKRELPELLRTDQEFRAFLIELMLRKCVGCSPDCAASGSIWATTL